MSRRSARGRDGARNRGAKRKRERAPSTKAVAPEALDAVSVYRAEKRRAAKKDKPTLVPIDEYRERVGVPAF